MYLDIETSQICRHYIHSCALDVVCSNLVIIIGKSGFQWFWIIWLMVQCLYTLPTGSLCRVYQSSWILRFFHLSDNFYMFPFIPLSIHSVCSFVIMFHCPWSLPLFVFADDEHLYFFIIFLRLGWVFTAYQPPSNKCHPKSSQNHPLPISETWLRYTCSIII